MKISYDIQTNIKTLNIHLWPLFYLLLFLSSCSSTQVKPFNEKTYVLNKTITVGKGEIIARETRGEVESRRNWVGIMNSEDGWSDAFLDFSNDFIDRKLIYQGYNQAGLHLLYREYKRGSQTPAIDQTRIFNVTDSPFAKLGGFNIEVVGGDDAGNLNFQFLDEQNFNRKKQQYKIAKIQREKEQAFQEIINSAEIAGKKTADAKAYAETLGVKNLDVYPELESSMTQAINTFNQAGQNVDNMDQSTLLFQQAENHFKEINKHLIAAIAALKAWQSLHEHIEIAQQSGIEEQYFLMATDLKRSGEENLMAGSFDHATALFTQATEEYRRIIMHFRNMYTNNGMEKYINDQQ